MDRRRFYWADPPSWLTQLLFYGSYLSIPVTIGALLRALQTTALMWWIIAILGLLFLWSRFVERYLLRTRTTAITWHSTARVAVLSDIHVGVFGKTAFLQKVVDRVNAERPDVVLIAGDFVLNPRPGTLHKLLTPLGDITVPTYAVLGDHDHTLSGETYTTELSEALTNLGVICIDNAVVETAFGTLIGLGDFASSQEDMELLSQANSETIVLTHNPYTTLLYNRTIPLTITGHTHAGQIRIPWFYKVVIPTHGSFDTGLTQSDVGQIFISSGVGESGLPLRLLNPPTIDILKLTPTRH